MNNTQILESEIRELLAACIFKYGPGDYAVKTLTDETFGFSPLINFNDIYECDYRITHYFHSIEDQKKLLDGRHDTFSKIKTRVKGYLDSLKVSCFSYSGSNNLMWAHYAANHSGVCYCLDSSIRNNSPFGIEDMSWGNVLYSSHVPELNIFQDKTTEGMLRALSANVVLTKSLEWSYEQEIRFFRRQEEEYFNYPPSALKAVIIGRRTPETLIDQMSQEINDFNKRHNLNTLLLYAHRVPSTYKVGVHSNRGFREGSEDSLSARIPVLSDINSPPLTSISENKD